MPARYDFGFKILTARYPFLKASVGSKLIKVMTVIKTILQTVTTAINSAYDARLINTASGTDLDKHGVTIDLPRIPGESDANYQSRLIVEFRDIPTGLTVEALKYAVDQVMGEGTEVDEYYKSIWDWLEYSDPVYSLFGNNSIGASSANKAADTKTACKFQIPSDGAIIYFRAYLKGAGGSRTAYASIYEDNAGAPDAKVADADSSVAINDQGWYEFDFTDVQLAKDTTYWLCINVTGGGWLFYYNAGTTNQAAYNTDTPPPDDPFGTPTYENRSYSIYIIYMVSDLEYSWERPFNPVDNRYYVAAIVFTEPNENELDLIEANVIAKKPSHIIVRIVELRPGAYELFREIK